MERQEVSAILEDEIDAFFASINLSDEYKSGKILCDNCSKPINKENLFAIYYEKKIRFCCNDKDCIALFKKSKRG